MECHALTAVFDTTEPLWPTLGIMRTSAPWSSRFSPLSRWPARRLRTAIVPIPRPMTVSVRIPDQVRLRCDCIDPGQLRFFPAAATTHAPDTANRLSSRLLPLSPRRPRERPPAALATRSRRWPDRFIGRFGSTFGSVCGLRAGGGRKCLRRRRLRITRAKFET